MKIIGQTEEGYILQATKTEVARITGKAWESESPRVGVGSEIQVSAMFDRMRKINEMPAEIRACQQTLKASAEILSMPLDLITQQTEATE